MSGLLVKSNLSGFEVGTPEVAFDQSGNLFAFDDNQYPSTIYSCNTTTGVETLEPGITTIWNGPHGTVDLDIVDAASFAPVPEPWTFGLGLAGIGLFLRRRRRI